MIKLSFYDHERQRYALDVPLRGERVIAEMMIGDYQTEHDGGGGVRDGGEFAIVLIDHIGPQLHVFGDAMGSLRKFLDTGGEQIMEEDYRDHIALSEALIEMGIEDRSDNPLEGKVTRT